MTTKRVCAQTGMSPGSLSYYFEGKEDVLFAMVRLNNRLLMEVVASGLAQATTRWDRLEAIITGNFPEGLFETNIANAWLSVCAASATNQRYARLHRIFYARLQSNLASVFRDVLPDARFKQVALALGAIIHDLWLRRAAGKALTPKDSIALVPSVAVALLTEAERAELAA